MTRPPRKRRTNGAFAVPKSIAPAHPPGSRFALECAIAAQTRCRAGECRTQDLPRCACPPDRLSSARVGTGAQTPGGGKGHFRSCSAHNPAGERQERAMDSFELNKIFGAILGTLLFVMGV